MKIEPAAALVGDVAVPGDEVDLAPRGCCSARSPTARARSATSAVPGDTESTISAVRALGVEVIEATGTTIRVRGVGLRGLRARTGRSTAATPAR